MTRLPRLRLIATLTALLALTGSLFVAGPASAAPTVTISGRVFLGSTARPAAAGEVRVVLGNDAIQSTFTDSAGRYSFTTDPVENIIVTFHYLGDDYQPSTEVFEHVAANVARDTVLPASSSISGVARLRSGAPVAGIYVVASTGSQPFGLSQRGTARSDANGAFRIDGLPAGDYWVEFLRTDTVVAQWVGGSGGAYQGTQRGVPPATRVDLGAIVLDAFGSVTGAMGCQGCEPGSLSAALQFRSAPGAEWVWSASLGDRQILPNSYTLTGVYPGEYRTVAIFTRADGDGQRLGYSAPYTVTVGQTTAAPAVNVPQQAPPIGGPPSGPPIGYLDSVMNSSYGRFVAAGWALDPDTVERATVHIYVDGALVAQTRMNFDRPDVARAFPSHPNVRGFSLDIGPFTPGRHTVCVYAINMGPPAPNPLLGCQQIFSFPARPFGYLDQWAVYPGGSASVSGWTIDRDAWGGGFNLFAVSVDGVEVARDRADRVREDVGRAFGLGSNHGFFASFTLAPGTHRICATGINLGTIEPDSPLGCVTLTTMSGRPFGWYDSATPSGPGSVTVEGWAIDPDTSDPIEMHLYVDGVLTTRVTAQDERAGIGALYPQYGSRHAMSVRVAGLAAGSHSFCLYAVDTDPAAGNSLIGCRNAVVPGGAPFGYLDTLRSTAPGTVTAGGWAIDPDTADPLAVRLTVDGRPAGSVTADRDRADVARVHPGYGTGHGFSTALEGLSGGAYTVCATAVGSPAGSADASLGCLGVTVPSGVPFGYLDRLTPAGPGTVSVRGWSIDPDTAAALTVRISIDGVDRGPLIADRERTDVAAVFAGYGTGHGFEAPVTGVSPGRHQVCAVAVNVGAGAGDPSLGCLTVTVPSGNPFGYLDRLTATAPGTVTVRGWSIDPDTVDPLIVRVSVDGVDRGPLTADRERTDVAAVFPGYGTGHGFEAPVTGLSVGRHQVCASAINVGAGTGNPSLGCLAVTVG